MKYRSNLMWFLTMIVIVGISDDVHSIVGG